MKPDAHDEWMDELFAGKEVEAFRQASLRHGITLIKKRRGQRRVRQMFAIALPMLLIGLGVWNYRPSAQKPQALASVSVPAISAPASKVRLIKDDDLFALFPNRPLALIGSPGHRTLVFLDERRPTSSQ